MERKREEEGKERALFLQKQAEEENEQKRKQRDQGIAIISKWESDRKKRIEKMRVKNKEEEKAFIESLKTNHGDDVWDRVISLIDVKESDYKGGKNVGRMRQCILCRKKDGVKK